MSIPYDPLQTECPGNGAGRPVKRMVDLENVIKGIEMCISPDECSPDECPYYERPDNASGLCWDRLMTDALALLKELEAAYQGAEELLRQKTILFDDAIKRLKEQETKTGRWICLQFCANEGVYCSECHTKMFDRYPMKKKLSQFCGHCGAKMNDEVERR